ncbi:hypothetical protein MSAN_00002800 [Mycena sanguinolenta]|uniref:Uncharacterized protein n=1 Tax=Mycena sanguinolenta TaxID=230812 RepID=A0A8H6ZE66_9AGAR|nr:hypothetical protein MSAN_00002800 [Mycena sanguinolenta]
MAAKYLCCLPLRLGVLLMSFFLFLASGAVSGVLAYLLVREAQGRPVFETHKNGTSEEVTLHFSSRTRTVGIVLAVAYGLVAIISFTGFLGAIRKKESYVRVFSRLLQGSLAVQIILVIAYFVLYFGDRKEFTKLCANNSKDQATIDNCDNLSKSVWVFVVAAIIPILSQAYGVYIVASYVQKLHNERFLHEESFGFKGQSYAPVSDESHPLTHQGPYPYADNSHSFGGQLP